MSTTAAKLFTYIPLLLLSLALSGCSTFWRSPDRLTPAEVSQARQHGDAIVEAHFGAGRPHVSSMRSDGYEYPIQITSVLLPSTSGTQFPVIRDYHRAPHLRPGRYLLILRNDLYLQAERLGPGSRRTREVTRWLQRP